MYKPLGRRPSFFSMLAKDFFPLAIKSGVNLIISLFKEVLKKPLTANVQEVEKNIRSRSAKLRYAVRNNSSFFYPDEFKKKFVNYLNLERGVI